MRAANPVQMDITPRMVPTTTCHDTSGERSAVAILVSTCSMTPVCAGRATGTIGWSPDETLTTPEPPQGWPLTNSSTKATRCSIGANGTSTRR